MSTLYYLLFAVLLAGAPVWADDLNEQLLAAVRKSNVAAVKDLLAKGADANTKSSYGQTPLFFACDRGNVEIVKMLLEKGVDVNAKDTFYNSTAMSWAAMKQNVEVVRLLLDKGASDVDGVLMSGVQNGNADMVKVAIASGKLKPAALTNALAMAEKQKKPEIEAVLKDAGAQPRAEAKAQVPAEVLSSYAGRYLGGRGGTEMEISVGFADGKLSLTVTGQKPLTLAAVSSTLFRGVEFDQVEIEFVSKDGAVTGMNLMQSGQTLAFKRVGAK
jgi:hypothetical protein